MAEPTQLDRIEGKLATIELEQRQQTALLVAIVTGGQLVATQLDTLIQTLNDNTNAVSARIDKLIAEIGNQVTPDQLAALQAVSD
ncbi:MAG TPA: hypothetical protein VI172_13695, partial [Candidatus Dormibacteraeota bacterium]